MDQLKILENFYKKILRDVRLLIYLMIDQSYSKLIQLTRCKLSWMKTKTPKIASLIFRHHCFIVDFNHLLMELILKVRPCTKHNRL